MENRADKINLTFQVKPERLSQGGRVYVAHCVELDITDQGETDDLAISNTLAAVQLWFDTASKQEIAAKLAAIRRRKTRIYTTQFEVPHGQIARTVGR